MRMPTDRAAIWSLLGGYMLLPSNYEVDVAFLPPLDKMAFASIATVLLCWMKGGQTPSPKRPFLIVVLALIIVVSPVLTSFDNGYELQSAGKSVHGFFLEDGIKFGLRNLIGLIPLYIGWRFLSTDRARAFLLTAIPSATVVYSLPMLFEVRMSPQLHRWIYGYFPSTFAQQMRADGFRPVVFFSHGLALALFVAVAVLAAIVLMRMRSKIHRFAPGPIAAYLGGLLLLCKSFGPVIYAVVFAPIILWMRPRTWVKIGCVIALVVCAYPLLRNHDLAPTQFISDLAQKISPERQASYQVRVENEEMLLEKANQKPLVGWGGWGRNRVFDKWTGQDISVTDGGWIIQYGTYGWVGYLSLFGLFFVALYQALKAMDREVTRENLVRGGLALLLTLYVADAIPNGMQTPIAFLLAGCVASRARRSSRRAKYHMSAAVVLDKEFVPAS